MVSGWWVGGSVDSGSVVGGFNKTPHLMEFSEPPPLYHILSYFPPTTSLPCVIDEKVPNYGMKKKIFSVYGCLSVKGGRKSQYCSFKLLAHLILHKDTQVLASHVGKIMEL